MFGMPKLPFGMLGVAGGADTRPTNSPEDMSALQKLFAATQAANQTPNGRVSRGFNQFGPQPPAAAPMLPTPPTPAPVDTGNFPMPKQAPVAPVLSSANQPSPLDNAQWPAGPNGAPQAAPQAGPAPTPDFTGQTYNLPIGSGYQMPAFGPTPSADASGPDVIQKLMSFFHNKDDPSST